MHRVGYDWKFNELNVHQLNLAKSKDALASAWTERYSPFDHILDYLELNSLSTLAAASKQSKQMVEIYDNQHAQKNQIMVSTHSGPYQLRQRDRFDSLIPANRTEQTEVKLPVVSPVRRVNITIDLPFEPLLYKKDIVQSSTMVFKGIGATAFNLWLRLLLCVVFWTPTI